MKNNNFKSYGLIWIIYLLIFNVVVFFVKPIIPGYTISYDSRFWIAWSFIIIAFIINLFCASITFKQENLKKLFYKVSLITISKTGLIVTLILGIILMLIPDCPYWISVIVCFTICGLTLIAVNKANWSSNIVEDIDKKIENNTSFIKSLTSDAEILLTNAKTEEAKNLCKKVYDAIRYSDPMSNNELSSIESQIKTKFDEFLNAVIENNSPLIESLTYELIILINNRNKKCKISK
jgi:FlaA1/EpsC-like NDP-sugar epimerase